MYYTDLDRTTKRTIFQYYLSNGVIKEILKRKKIININTELGIEEDILISKDLEELDNNTELEILIYKEYNNYNMRKYRCYKKIEDIVNNYNNWKFITFTLNDNSINFNREYIEKKIKTTLNKYTDKWLFNLDISPKERLHYHGVIGYNKEFKYIDLINEYGLGAVKITSYKNNNKALAKYITKLTNHGMKEKTDIKIHYSRKKISK